MSLKKSEEVSPVCATVYCIGGRTTVTLYCTVVCRKVYITSETNGCSAHQSHVNIFFGPFCAWSLASVGTLSNNLLLCSYCRCILTLLLSIFIFTLLIMLNILSIIINLHLNKRIVTIFDFFGNKNVLKFYFNVFALIFNIHRWRCPPLCLVACEEYYPVDSCKSSERTKIVWGLFLASSQFC